MSGRGLKINFETPPTSFLTAKTQTARLVGLATSQVAGLLVGVDVPDHVVGQTDNLVAGALGHLGESLGLGLVLEGIRGEVDTYR